CPVLHAGDLPRIARTDIGGTGIPCGIAVVLISLRPRKTRSLAVRTGPRGLDPDRRGGVRSLVRRERRTERRVPRPPRRLSDRALCGRCPQLSATAGRPARG